MSWPFPCCCLCHLFQPFPFPSHSASDTPKAIPPVPVFHAVRQQRPSLLSPAPPCLSGNMSPFKYIEPPRAQCMRRPGTPDPPCDFQLDVTKSPFLCPRSTQKPFVVVTKEPGWRLTPDPCRGWQPRLHHSRPQALKSGLPVSCLLVQYGQQFSHGHHLLQPPSCCPGAVARPAGPPTGCGEAGPWPRPAPDAFSCRQEPNHHDHMQWACPGIISPLSLLSRSHPLTVMWVPTCGWRLDTVEARSIRRVADAATLPHTPPRQQPTHTHHKDL